MINRVTVAGRLGRDPEYNVYERKDGSSDVHVVTFTIAVPRFGDKDGDNPNWFKVKAFGEKFCKNIAKVLQKGDKITLEGRLEQNKWENQDGEPRSRIEIVATDWELHARGKDNIPQDADVDDDSDLGF